jgi:hypothetical protein
VSAVSVEPAPKPGDPELETTYLERRYPYRGREPCESSAEEVVDQQRRCSDEHWARPRASGGSSRASMTRVRCGYYTLRQIVIGALALWLFVLLILQWQCLSASRMLQSRIGPRSSWRNRVVDVQSSNDFSGRILRHAALGDRGPGVRCPRGVTLCPLRGGFSVKRRALAIRGTIGA